MPCQGSTISLFPVFSYWVLPPCCRLFIDSAKEPSSKQGAFLSQILLEDGYLRHYLTSTKPPYLLVDAQNRIDPVPPTVMIFISLNWYWTASESVLAAIWWPVCQPVKSQVTSRAWASIVRPSHVPLSFLWVHIPDHQCCRLQALPCPSVKSTLDVPAAGSLATHQEDRLFLLALSPSTFLHYTQYTLQYFQDAVELAIYNDLNPLSVSSFFFFLIALRIGLLWLWFRAIASSLPVSFPSLFMRFKFLW